MAHPDARFSLLGLTAALLVLQLALILLRTRPDDGYGRDADPGPPLDPVLEPEIAESIAARRVAQ